ncbi:MAG: hypothetical protein EBU07_07365 [Betaproteobacteria bacterium]|nr:hypothetical protein [Betaproteobacteria bacterium]
MLDVLMLAVIAIGFLGAVVVFIYIVDRINSLERQTRELVTAINANQSNQPAKLGPFGGLSGRRLWDAMCGKPEGLSPEVVADIRTRYADVLMLHLRSTFDEGVKDAQIGASGTPKNPRPINSEFGTVESWLPTSDLAVVYNAGIDSITKNEFDLTAVRNAFDAAVTQLHRKASLTPPPTPLSALWMPAPPEFVAGLQEGSGLPPLPNDR